MGTEIGTEPPGWEQEQTAVARARLVSFAHQLTETRTMNHDEAQAFESLMFTFEAAILAASAVRRHLRAARSSTPLDDGPNVDNAICPFCPHPRSAHTNGGICHGGETGNWCMCVRFPDSPDEPLPAPLDDGGLDADQLGFADLLDVADALLTRYPPDTIVCSHEPEADVGARTVASIADLIASCRPGSGRDTEEPGMSETVKLVCSVCGSDNLSQERQRSVDDRWPMAICRDHKDRRQIWTPLISERAFVAKKHRLHDEKPVDLFGELSEDEKAALKRPIKLL